MLERALTFNVIEMVRQPLRRFEQRITLSYLTYIKMTFRTDSLKID